MATNKAKKLTKEEIAAMEVMAMLQGVSVEELANSYEKDDIEIEIEDEKPTKKSRKIKEKVVIEEKPKQPNLVPTLPHFENLKSNIVINVVFGVHDIHYKEQLWNIPTREVKYNIELVTNPKVAKDCANIMNENNKEDEARKAYEGKTRYYKVITYENVVGSAREIGYIKVIHTTDGKLKGRQHIDKALLKRINISYDRLHKQLQGAIAEIVNQV